MSAPVPIRSRANPALKRVAAALVGKDREHVVLEGERLVGDALAAGWAVELALVAEDRPERAARLEGRARELRLVDAALLARVSSLDTSPGVLALCARPPERPVAELEARADALVLVAASVADPGNLGALARSAEAFGCTALVAVSGANPWNAKALRGSMGSLLRLPVHGASDPRGAADELARLCFRQVRAATRGGTPLPEFNWSGPLALWVSSETGELPELGRSLEDVTIPMARGVESLNVAVAAAVLLHAAGRVH